MNEAEQRIRQLADQPPPKPSPTTYTARPDHTVRLLPATPTTVAAQCSCGAWWRPSGEEATSFDAAASWAASHGAPSAEATEGS